MIESKSIFIDILLTIITGGLWNLWVQYRQIRDSNLILPPDRRKSFLMMLILTFITFGIYFIWHEYRLTKDLHIRSQGREKTEVEILCAVATFFGLWFIVDSYQQSLLNDVAI